jgi:hypothetical protein
MMRFGAAIKMNKSCVAVNSFILRNFTKRRSLSDDTFFHLMTEQLREKMDRGRMSTFIGHHLCLSLDAIRPLMELPQLGMPLSHFFVPAVLVGNKLRWGKCHDVCSL